MGKILLVQQYLGNNHEVGPIFPLGLAYLATAIHNSTSWDIKAIDMNVYDEPYKELDTVLSSYQPNVVALSLRNIDNVDYEDFNYFYLELKPVAQTIKKYNCHLIVGGAGYSIFAKEIIERNHEIDYGLVQEGEETIVELLNSIDNALPVNKIKGLYYRESSCIKYTGDRPPLNFSNSSIPIRDYFDTEKYLKPLCLGVQTKRGCSLKCSYCTYPYLSKNTERFRNPESVIDEIEELVEKYGAKEIIFCDDIFNVPVEHSIRIIQGIIDRGIVVKWSAWFDIANTTEDFMRLAIQSGCYRFCFSTEGVTDKSLTLLKKNFSVSQADRLIRLCGNKEFKCIDFRFSLFAMPPGQTIYGMIKTICIVFITHVLRKNSKCLVSWIRILPNTELFRTYRNGTMELLPEQINDKTKDSLFYNNQSYPSGLLYLYKKILSLMGPMRELRKKAFPRK